MSWDICKTKNKVDIYDYILFDEWKQIIITNKKDIIKLDSFLLQEIQTKIVCPTPDLVFNAFNYVKPSDIKIILLGQDPYPTITEPHGLSFSVPAGVKIPSSLKNIFKNLKKFNHINNIPTSGDLTHWAQQGVLLLNCSLTVPEKQKNKHYKYWSNITDNIITHVSNNYSNIIFLLFGSFALDKLNLINTSNNHLISVSSHPSGLSCRSKLGNYECFDDTDHFGIANKHLIDSGLTPINW